jgi:hypothetical protein
MNKTVFISQKYSNYLNKINWKKSIEREKVSISKKVWLNLFEMIFEWNIVKVKPLIGMKVDFKVNKLSQPTYKLDIELI